MNSGILSLPWQRVLIVTPLYPPRNLGGTQLRARKLARWLVSRGISVEVVCVEEMLPGDHDGIVGVQREVFEDVLVHRLYLAYTRSLTAFRRAYDHPQIEAYLERVIAERRPDLIHLISGYLVTACAIKVARAHNIPSVVTLTDYWFICPRINLIRANERLCTGPHSALDCTRCLLSESRRYRLPEQLLSGVADLVWRLLARSDRLKDRIALYSEATRRQHLLVNLLNQADAVIIPTNSLRPRLVRAGVEDRFYLSRHSIVPTDLGIQPDSPKSESQSFRFGYLGTLLPIKAADLLVHAYRQLAREYRDISLAIWGDASIRPGYATELRKALERVPDAAIRGRYQPSQIGELMRDIDMLVAPSRWPEIGPFIILEAFATQTPVIAARIGNMPELVEHNVNGLVFEPDSVTDLQTQMRRVLDEPGLYEHLRSGMSPVRTQEDEMEENIEVYRHATQQVVRRLNEPQPQV
jgi:glycosyltransferase involved in cell wall biosynthesis